MIFMTLFRQVKNYQPDMDNQFHQMIVFSYDMRGCFGASQHSAALRQALLAALHQKRASVQD